MVDAEATAVPAVDVVYASGSRSQRICLSERGFDCMTVPRPSSATSGQMDDIPPVLISLYNYRRVRLFTHTCTKVTVK